MTMDEKILDEIESVALEMRVELDGLKRLAQMIENDLFGRTFPEKEYTDYFEHYQALYHMMTAALYKFEAEFSLLTGDGSTHYYECVTQRPNKLREIDKWWNTPRKNGRAV